MLLNSKDLMEIARHQTKSLGAEVNPRTFELKYAAGQPRDGHGRFANAGGGVGVDAAGQAAAAAHNASDIRSTVQTELGTKASSFREKGSQTYVSTMMESPNMGERHFIDISNKDSKIQSKQASEVQSYMDGMSTSIRGRYPGTQTYVSQQTSPNMGTRVFMDVKAGHRQKTMGSGFGQPSSRKPGVASQALADLRKERT